MPGFCPVAASSSNFFSYITITMPTTLPNQSLATAHDPAYRELPPPDQKAYLSDQLRRILEQVDKRLPGKVNQNASLLEHGLQSLAILQFFSQIQKRIGVMLPLATIAAGGRLVDLAEILHGELAKAVDATDTAAASDAAVVPAGGVVDRSAPFPLTDVQRAYWVGKSDSLELGGIGTHFYNEYECEYLDLPRLNRALNRMIERHAMLRCIVTADGQQRILAEVPPYEIEVVRLLGLSERESLEQERKTRERMEYQVLASDVWPLFDIKVAMLGLRRYQLRIYIDNLIFDASSYATFLRELGSLYENPEQVLPALEYQFQDYVLASREHRASAGYRASVDFWREVLREMPPRPELSLSRQPAQIKNHRTRRVEGRLPAEQWRRLKLIAQDMGCTSSGLLMNVYADILNLWSKSPRFTISMTVFNRPAYHDQINDILGDFTNIIFIPVDRSAPRSFRERAHALQQQVWQCLEHKQVEIGEVQRIYQQLHQEMAEAVPVVFTSLLGSEWGEPYSSSWLGDITYNMTQTPQVWIDHVVLEAHGDLVYFWDYVEEIFPEGYIEAMFEAYGRHLEALLTESGWRQRSLAHLLPEEQRERRQRFNATDERFPDLCLHEMFERQAERQPDRIAILAPERSFTYAEVDRLANCAARYLLDHGVGANELVAVVMNKGWEQVVAVLAILKAGAAYLPISPTLPHERLALLLEDGKVRQVLTHQPPLQEISWPDDIRRLDIDEDVLEQYGADRPNAPRASGNLAYVIYTSGSTGAPKGVMIDHRGAVNTICDINTRFAITGEDRVLALSSLSFDLSVYDIFGMLSAGGAIVFPEVEREHDPRHWSDLLREQRVTVWNSVPALIGLLVDSLLKRGQALPDSLRLVMMSGDWIPMHLPEQIRSLSPSVAMHSLGGATEASIWSIHYPIGSLDPDWSSIPYGYPLANQRIYLLDHQLDPKPEGVVGDLYIGGIGLALGYWNNPERTRDSFIRHPVSGERLYRTGDLGRLAGAGHVEFLGRRDSQIKIRGYRVELGEIEAQLARNLLVDRAVVVPLGTAKSIRSLAAYITLKPATRPQFGNADPAMLSAFLKKWLGERLPDYMVPAHYMVLEQLPLTANGKVNKSRLPAVDLPSGAPAMAAETSIQKVLAQLCREVADLDGIGIHDNFFALGYDSIQIIKLIDRLREALEVDLTMREVLSHPTVAQLEQLIAADEDNLAVAEQSADLFLKIEGMSEAELENYAKTN